MEPMPPGSLLLCTEPLDRPRSEVARLLGLLTAEERLRAGRFHRRRDGERWIVARAALRMLLGRRLELPPGEVVLLTDARGKPHVAAPEPLHFNLSHSAGLALYAITPVGPVGVDVEAVEGGVRPEEIALRFFSPREQSEFLSLPAEARIQGFLHGWTRKEALVKATGEGLFRDLASFDVSLTPGHPARLLGWRERDARIDEWSLLDVDPGPGYVGAVAVRGEVETVRWEGASLRAPWPEGFDPPRAVGR